MLARITKRLAGFSLRWSGWLVVLASISIASHLSPILTKATQSPRRYAQTEQALVSIGAPVWDFAATILAPMLSWGFYLLFNIDRTHISNLVLNSTPRDGSKYLETATTILLAWVFVIVVPSLWNLTTRTFRRE